MVWPNIIAKVGVAGRVWKNVAVLVAFEGVAVPLNGDRAWRLT